MKVVLALFSLLSVWLDYTRAEKTCSYQIDKFKVALTLPTSSPSPEQLLDQQVYAKFNTLPFMSKNVIHTNENEPFDAHLIGVNDLLRGWDVPHHVQLAGLFHSVYGTEGFDPGKSFVVPYTSRPTIIDAIGAKAERLSFIFCVLERFSLDQVLSSFYSNPKNSKKSSHKLKSRLELGGFTITVSKEELLDFITLSLADWMEQVEGAAQQPNASFGWKSGEAYAYRRSAYESMATILLKERGLGISMNSYRAVMGVEGEKTKKLEQRRTPPLEERAKDAWDCVLSDLGEGESTEVRHDWTVRVVETTKENE